CGLIFSSALATSALWRSSVALDGGTVRAGSVVLLTGSGVEQVKSYAFTTLSGTALRPGSSVQAPLVVRNGGTSTLAYRLAGTASTGSSLLAGQLVLRVDAVPVACTTGVGAAIPPVVTANAYDGPA
ncbi:hypothetical protein, partial [Acinetobacter baumannii]|uniref:hypothetical protein n=1 Tax=Acinetobacter baumannii TaxID=470 RepID=UPI0018E0883D